MREYLIKYRPFLLFLAKFFLVYVALTIVYRFYLSQYDDTAGEVDYLTRAVASQSENLMFFFGAETGLIPHFNLPFIKLFYNGKYVARIIEGCNAVSVMILFISFIVAFKGKCKHTVIFAILGCVVIHILNIARIALLGSAMYHLPQHEHILHGVVFPLFIYSVVFILWVIWVNKFSVYASKSR